MRRRFIHPDTGDELTLTEHLYWKVQGVIRTPWFLLGFTALTLVVWFTGGDSALLWWNLCASYLAIFVESVVGFSLFGQTKRDAKVIRHIEGVAVHTDAIVTHLGIDIPGKRGESNDAPIN